MRLQPIASSELDHEHRPLEEHIGAGIAKLGFVIRRIWFEEIVP
jgi:hypothetical protein